ncbi:hypothetical protein K8I61_12195 [bacterium]|nr:hypothetical protein [bacterium]
MPRFAPLALVVFLAASQVFVTCGGDDAGSPKGEGFTGDVGVDCVQKGCTDPAWCLDPGQAACVSLICAGRANGETYCTMPCDYDEQCPDGYRCTYQCDDDMSETDYCVTDSDYGHMVDFALCPA